MNNLDSVLQIEGVKIRKLDLHLDPRGTFVKFFVETLSSGLPMWNEISSILVENREKGVLRGLHFQSTQKPEEKTVFCHSGSIYDVLVDLRPHSETFCMWAAIELTANNPQCLVIPPGVAHGYQTLESNSLVAYLIKGEFDKSASQTINVFDSFLQIPWPINAPIISDQDRDARLLRDYLASTR